LPVVALERQSPGEYLAAASLNGVCGGKGLRQGSKPRDRGASVRPEDSSEGAAARETVRGCTVGRKAGGTLREEKTPKGEKPHERCRDETSPNRLRREQSVKRVAKP